jgi:hypothetical protein
MPPRKVCQQIHANKRAKQRLGIDFNRHKAKEVIDGIHSNKFIFGAWAGKNRAWYKGTIDNVLAWVLWDKGTNRIVTMLDHEPREIQQYKDAQAKKAVIAQRRASKAMEEAQKKREARAAMLSSMKAKERKEYRKQERILIRESLGFHIYTKEERMA